MKTCPFCAEEIQDAAVVCKHCHRDLAASAAHAPQVEAIAGRATKGVIVMLVKIAVGVAVLAVALTVVGVFGLSLFDRVMGDPEPPLLNDAQREQMLRSAIVDAGKECREVTKFARLRLDERTGDSVWMATCFQGAAYEVLMKRNGEGRVLR